RAILAARSIPERATAGSGLFARLSDERRQWRGRHQSSDLQDSANLPVLAWRAARIALGPALRCRLLRKFRRQYTVLDGYELAKQRSGRRALSAGHCRSEFFQPAAS